MPVATVRGVISKTTIDRKIDPEDAQLATDLRRLVRLAVKKAFIWMEWGTPETQIALIRTVLSPATARLIGSESGASIQDERKEFEALLTRITSVPKVSKEVTAEDIIDVVESADTDDDDDDT